jgi:hypothetical protein
MAIFRTDVYGSNGGSFFECCQQNKNKHNEDEINKLALRVEQCFVLGYSGTAFDAAIRLDLLIFSLFLTL